MRILDKYLSKELVKTFLAVLMVLLLIIFGSEATKLLSLAAEGGIPSSIILRVLLLKIPLALEVILPLVALLSVMIATGRLYQDQEMVVMSSCGISPVYFQKIVSILLLLPLVIFTAWISLLVTPWSYQTEQKLINEAQATTLVSGLVAGRFNPVPNNIGDFYIKYISESGVLFNIWIQRQVGQEDIILVASTGRFELQNANRVLVLENGFQYKGLHSKSRKQSQQIVKVQKFTRLTVLIPKLTVKQARPSKFAVSTKTLWQSDNLVHQSLLQWRLVTPLGVLVFGLIGLKMGKTGPREGSFVKIFFAIVLYIIYNQLLIVGREGIADGTWSTFIGLWPIPLLFLILALVDFKQFIPKLNLKAIKSQFRKSS